LPFRSQSTGLEARLIVARAPAMEIRSPSIRARIPPRALGPGALLARRHRRRRTSNMWHLALHATTIYG
jgi:hypothetical protein